MEEKVKEKKQTEKPTKKGKVRGKNLPTRGRTFQGLVVRKFPKRVAIEFGRTVYIPKYERYLKKTTRIHARLPDSMFQDIHEGDLIKVKECRPLSKLIHFIVIEKIKSGDK